MPTLVTVVIATYRRPGLLDRCLYALLTQNFAPDAYEIIIVDDGPEDASTRALVAEWQQRLMDSYTFLVPPVVASVPSALPVTGRESTRPHGNQAAPPPPGPETQTVFQVQPGAPGFPRLYYLPAYHTQGPAAARNLGWRAAAGEIIAFTDDDTIPDPQWLANGVSAFVGDVAGVSGRVIVPLPPEPTDNERNTTYLERSDFVTANCFYRRGVLEAVGGFDERFKTAWREDSDLYFTIRERGYPLAWASGAIVRHPVRPERWGSSIRAQKKSFYNALLYKKHPALYRCFIQSAPPWHYYGMILSLLVALAGAFANPLLSLAGLGVWAALEARFILRRLKDTSRKRDHVIEMAATSLVIPFLSVYWRLKGALRWRVWFI